MGSLHCSACLVLLIIPAVDLVLHIKMDKYAMIAVTCSEKFLDKYTDIITAENRIWASRHAEGKRYIRELQVSWLVHTRVFSTQLVRQCM